MLLIAGEFQALQDAEELDTIVNLLLHLVKLSRAQSAVSVSVEDTEKRRGQTDFETVSFVPERTLSRTLKRDGRS